MCVSIHNATKHDYTFLPLQLLLPNVLPKHPKMVHLHMYITLNANDMQFDLQKKLYYRSRPSLVAITDRHLVAQ